MPKHLGFLKLATVAVALSGCGASYQSTISAVPSDFPADMVATIHCSETCRKISDESGTSVAKIHGSFGYSYLTDIRVVPGTYSIEVAECDSSTIALPNELSVYEINASEGGEYFVRHSGTKRYSNYFCYIDIYIEDEYHNRLEIVPKRFSKYIF